MNPFSNNRNAMMHQQSYSAEPYREGMDFTDEAWAYGLRALPGSLANQLQALGEYTTGKDYPNKLSNYLDELTQVNEMGYTPQTEYEKAVAFLPELVYDPAIIAGAPYAAYKAARGVPRALNVLADEAGRTGMRNQIGAAGVKSQLGAVGLPMDEASRMARAREMGFPVGNPYLYRGTSGNETEAGKWLTSNPEYADLYATGEGGNVMPLMMRGDTLDTRTPDGKNLFDEFLSSRDWEEGYKPSLMPSGLPEYDNWQFFDWLKEKGINPGSILLDERNGHFSIKVLKPENVRSIHATFDPAKKDSADLLASRLLPIPAGLLGLTTLDPDN